MCATAGGWRRINTIPPARIRAEFKSGLPYSAERLEAAARDRSKSPGTAPPALRPAGPTIAAATFVEPSVIPYSATLLGNSTSPRGRRSSGPLLHAFARVSTQTLATITIGSSGFRRRGGSFWPPVPRRTPSAVMWHRPRRGCRGLSRGCPSTRQECRR